MKTTIDIPPDLIPFTCAAGVSLPEIITELLRDHVAQSHPAPKTETDTLDWRDELWHN
jgi:hypothetical protein